MRSLPWPVELIPHIIDPTIMRPVTWPWPTKSWQYQKHILSAITAVNRAMRMMQTQKTKWTPEDDNFHEAVYEDAESFDEKMDKCQQSHQDTT